MRVHTITLLAALGILLLSVPCMAGRGILVETQHSNTPNGKEAAALVINGRVVAQLAKDQRNSTPMRSISKAAALIVEGYRQGGPELKVRSTDDSGRRFGLFLNGKLILLATDMEGKAWGADPEELANTWMTNIMAAWALPPTLPEIEEPPVTPPSQPTTPPTGGTLQLGGAVVSGGHSVYEPAVLAQVNHPLVPADLTALVTGLSLRSDDASRSVEQVIRSHARLPVGARLGWDITSPGGANLAIKPGQQRQLSVQYRVSGTGVEASSGKLSISLENRSLSTPSETLTFFSNKPEQLLETGLLYAADLPPLKSGRLVFHHQNQTRGQLTYVARLINQSGRDTAIHVIPGVSLPDVNTFYIGFKSAELFWKNLNANNGYVLNLPAGEQVYLVEQLLGSGQTASGYMKLTNLGEAAVRLETLAQNPGSTGENGMLHDNGRHFPVFGAPYFSQTASYSIGDNWLYLRLGEDQPNGLNGDSILHGCYGMSHSFDVELTNPGSSPSLVFLVLRASAGEVKGQFYLNDEYVVTPLVAGGEELMLKEIPLKPGETKLLKVRAIPLNGGFYPASLIVRQSRYP